MPNTKNIASVKDLESKLDGASAVFLADYAGLTVKAQSELRRKVREAGGELSVAKNSLLKIALKNKGYNVENLSAELTGPNLTLFTTSDAVAPLKVLVEYSKGKELEKPAIKGGYLGKDILSLEKVKELAALPGKNELVAKLLGTLSNPARNLVGVLSAPMRNFVYALSAVKDKKSAAA